MNIKCNKKGNKIHIKEENKGKFTDYCEGKITSECIQKGKNSPNPKIRKRAMFAANARKWAPKHLTGGKLSKYAPGGKLINKFVSSLVKSTLSPTKASTSLKLLSGNDYRKIFDQYLKNTKIKPKDMKLFRNAINKDDRFVKGSLLKNFFEKQNIPNYYVGHGMVKHGDQDALAVVRMMNKHGYDTSRSFYSSSLKPNRMSDAAPGGYYSDGPFIIVSDTRQPQGTISHVLINDSFENEAGKNLALKYKQLLDNENSNIPHILFSDIIDGTYKIL